MPSTFLAMRSSTTCTCSSPPPCSPGPIYMHSSAPLDSASAFLQPSRAWSKNGLFMFFGTSAKTYFLPCAWLLAPAAIAKARLPRPCRQRHQGAFACRILPECFVNCRRARFIRRAAGEFAGAEPPRHMNSPTNVPCQLESTPAIKRLLRITSMRAAPITAPKAPPSPPMRLAPPITVEAMTRSSYPVPSALMAEPCQPTIITEAMRGRDAGDDVGLELDALRPARR